MDEPVRCFWGWVPPRYVHLMFIHVMDETRPPPFFALFRLSVLYWTQTEEQKTGEAWERGYLWSSSVGEIWET